MGVTRKPVTREWLEQKYVVEGLDCTQIARLVSRDPKTVWNWMKDFGIPTRPRGHASSQFWFRKGDNHWQGRRHSTEARVKMRAIAKAEGRVPYDPKIGSYMKGRKGPNTTNWKGGITPERQSLYSSQEWREVVVVVWQRDNATCQRCGLDHRTVDRSAVRFHIHHIVGFQVRELRTDPANLVLLCDRCHRFVHSRGNVQRELIG